MIDHPFEALCALADRKNWCWKIRCTTCGHGHFRSGLWEVSLGRHPDHPGWVTGRPSPDGAHGLVEESFGQGFPPARQAALSEVCASANLRNIATQCSFPDWLGYLGLALRYTEDHEGRTRLLTKSWQPQFKAMVAEHPWRRSGHDTRVEDGVETWMGLGRWESELQGGPYARPRRR